MDKRLLTSCVAIFILCSSLILSAQEITKEVIAKIPKDIASSLVGLRVHKKTAFVLSNNGKYACIDLEKGSLTNHSLKTLGIIDFDVVAGKILYLDSFGMLAGHLFPRWHKGPYQACRIESFGQGVILSGGKDAFFLAKNATSAATLVDMNFLLPVNNGFLWSMVYGSDKLWEANLYDCFGNQMGKVYKFSQYFTPSNLEVGPQGIEGELLVSATEGNVRTLALIGNNGRMFWKINAHEKICPRDVAFDHNDNLLFLEKNAKGEVVLTKWSFIIPEG